jgi:hypothetical protein
MHQQGGTELVTKGQTFEEALQEIIDRTKTELMEAENPEFFPPPPPAPYPQGGPPVFSALSFDPLTIRRYAYSLGDDNPLYTDPAYARSGPYGNVIAPGPMLALVRYPSAHGADRPQGYPVANFISGAAWEFYDVIRVGSQFRSSKILKEFFEKSGAQGRLLFLISDVSYWDQTSELKAKCYGTQIYVPIEEMGTGRAMTVENVGRHMMYTRGTQHYSDEQLREILDALESEQGRGAEPRYWEDVEEGEALPPFVIPPFTVQDMIAYHQLSYSLTTGLDNGPQHRGFERAYVNGKKVPYSVRTHPITRWPYVPWDEHEDVFLAQYRGQPGPFDFGVQRAQIPQKLMANWMGDHGFLRKMYTAFRRPVFYGDATWYRGTVKKKYTVTETGEANPGVPGQAGDHAVAIEIMGTNQVGELQCPGFATVYLPSREHGPVQLPVPHQAEPGFVPYDTYRRIDWY